MSSTGQAASEKRQLLGLNTALVAEFILGAGLTTFVNFSPGKPGITQAVFLIAHIVIGVGLLAGSTARLVMSLRRHRDQLLSALGLLSLAGAFACGGISSSDGSTAAAFLMACFFVAALIIYLYSWAVAGRG